MSGGSREAGFTFVEILITMVTMTLVLAFAGPSLRQYSKSQEVKNAARRIYTAFQLARITAIKENTDVAVTITVGDQPSLSMQRSFDGSDVIPAAILNRGAPGVTVSSTRDGTIRFTPRGTIQGGQNQTFTLRHTEQGVPVIYDVVVNDSGGIRFAKK